MNQLSKKALGQACVSIQKAHRKVVRGKNAYSNDSALGHIKESILELAKARDWLTAVANTIVEDKNEDKKENGDTTE